MSARKRLKNVLAIDWDTQTLRIIHALINKRGITIDRLLSITIPSNVDTTNPEQMGQHIRRALDQEGLSTKHAIVDIPRDLVILKSLQLPLAKPEDLPGMVEIQIAKELPFPVKEAVIDYTVESKTAESTSTDILVAAVQHEQLEQYTSTFHHAGLKLDRIGLRPHANKVAVCKMLRFAIPDRVLFIDVRPVLTEIDVIHHGELSFSRAASVMIPKDVADTPSLSISQDDSTTDPGKPYSLDDAGSSNEVQEAPMHSPSSSSGLDGVINSMVLEVTRSIEAYRATDTGGRIDHVVIGGDMGIEERLTEVIQQRLDLTTELYNPASTFGWDPEEGAAASACSASLGLVLAQDQEPTQYFDFLHPKKVYSVTTQKLKKAPMIAAVFVLFMSALAVGFSKFTQADRDNLARIEQTIEKLEDKTKTNKKFLKLMDQIHSFDTDQNLWVDVIFDVVQSLPSHKELYILHMELKQGDGKLTLKTQSKNRDQASNVIKALNEFRRAGHTLPRFQANMGPQSEKKKELYPFIQEIRIKLLDDGKNGSTKTTKRSNKESD